LTLRTLPEDAALLKIDVADVEDKSTVTVLPLIVVGETKLGAAICYPQIIEAVTGDIPPLDTVDHDSVPVPLVVKTCPLVPVPAGRTNSELPPELGGRSVTELVDASYLSFNPLLEEEASLISIP
jgi:hypothetical protein